MMNVNKWKNKKIAVLLGGVTKERDISIKTGVAIFNALKKKGYNVIQIDAADNLFDKLQNESPDVVFIALHGKLGEDGCIQGALETMRVPYTGTGVLGSSVGMDKVVCNLIAKNLNIPLPKEIFFNVKDESLDEIKNKMVLEFPVIVKPSREGSTINMTIVQSRNDLAEAVSIAAKSDDKVIIQEYIKGKELTVGVLNGTVLPVLEIAPKSGFYDYKSKYTKGMTEYIVPARILEDIAKKMQRWSLDIYKALDCAGVARCDYILGDDNKIYFLEINTIPGMTELSLVPMAAGHIGISFEDLVEQILSNASLKVNI